MYHIPRSRYILHVPLNISDMSLQLEQSVSSWRRREMEINTSSDARNHRSNLGRGGGILGYLHRSSSSNDCCSALFDVSAQMISPDFVDYIYREAVNGNRFVSTTVPSRLEHVPRYTVSATKTYLRSLTNLYDTKGYTFNIGRNKISIVWGWEPWSSDCGRRLPFWRSRVWIPAPYAGWNFFILICYKDCNVCLKKTENKQKEAGMARFF